MPCSPVERVAWADLDPGTFLADFVAASRPVVITGALDGDGWAPLAWSAAMLEERCAGGRSVGVAPLQPAQHGRHAWLEPASRWPEPASGTDADGGFGDRAGLRPRRAAPAPRPHTMRRHHSQSCPASTGPTRC